jgi:oxygen-dependent protoporphyrinogen oxidase
MTEMEREHGSLIRAMFARRQRPPRLVSLAGGMGALTDALAERLGSALRTGASVRRLERTDGTWRVAFEDGDSLAADRVVLAAPATRAAPMLAQAAPELSAGLAAFPYAGLAVVALAFRAASLPLPLDGYGYLVARSEELDTLGVVWDSSLFDGRSPEGLVLVRAMLGGARRPQVVTLDEDELVRRARREFARVMGGDPAPVRTWVWRWPQSIAQYTRGHLERVARARALAARLPGLELCGTSYDGIALGPGIISAERAVERVLAGSGAGGAGAPAAAATNGSASTATAATARAGVA